jgi:serine/threonine-protein kinase
MGEVYVATQLGMGEFRKPLALKLLLPHLTEDGQAVQMFLHEAHLAAKMNHPNVVQIFDVGKEDERYFIAMELVRGVPVSIFIEALAAAGRKLPAELLIYVGRALCEGLHHAHELADADGGRLEVVHRDVTPHNVLLSVDGAVKLTDFGIAKARDYQNQTRPGAVKGKLAYVSPEHVRGEPVDRRADIFGVSLTLWHLATLQSPFSRDNEAATLRAVEGEPLPPLTDYRPEFPDELVEAVARGAEKEPARRFPSALAFRDALPFPPAGAPQALGELVAELCHGHLKVLEDKTALALDFMTQADTGSGTIKPRLWPRVAVFAGAVGVGLAAAAWAVPRWSRPDFTPLPPSPPAPQLALPPVEKPLGIDLTRADPPPSPPPVVAHEHVASKARPKPVAEVGYLTIDAQPWASVYLGNKLLGETPISRFPVEAGTFDLKFANPELDKVVHRRVRVDPGKDTLVRVSLQ